MSKNERDLQFNQILRSPLRFKTTNIKKANLRSARFKHQIKSAVRTRAYLR